MQNGVALVGGGLSRFGKRTDASFRDLVMEAVKEAFESSRNLTTKDVQTLCVAASQPEREINQSHIAALVAEYVGASPEASVSRIEMGCASGSVAIRAAYVAIKAGEADIALVVGAEKMFSAPMAEVQTALTIVPDRDWEGIFGLNAPPGFALIAQRHMHEYGTTLDQMAEVAVKNHHHGSMNPKAQFRKPISKEDVSNSPIVSRPLRLYDCSPITDGAAAVILTSADRAKEFTDTPVYIRGLAQSTHGNTVSNIPSLTTWTPLVTAARKAFQASRLTPNDVDVAETHDCFTIAEIIEYEDLGFTEKGKGGNFIEEGQSQIGGKVAVNTSGGLKAKGHPIAATGVAQAVEIMHQLRGDAGDRQVSGAEVGLTHNLSGFAVNHTVTIYGR